MTMTITLHWWMLPLALFLGGWIFCGLHEMFRYRSNHWDFNFFGPLVGIAGTIAAICILIGRSLVSVYFDEQL